MKPYIVNTLLYFIFPCSIVMLIAPIFLPGHAIVYASESVGTVGSQSAALSSADLLIRIDKELSRLPKPTAYLYETTTLKGIIAATWVEMTAGILGTKDLRVSYDNLYQSSIEYAGLVEINLRRAKRAMMNNDPATGNRLLEAALRYEQQFYLNDRAAIEAYNGNIAASAELAKGIYEGSKASVIYGSSMVMGPVGSRVVDTVFDATDFAVEASDNGLSSATKKFVAGKITEMIFSHIPVATLNGKTLKDTIDRGATKTLGNAEIYKIVRQAVSTPEFAKTLMSFMAKSGAYTANKITADQVNTIVTALLEEGAIGYCGSSDLQKLLIPEYVCYGLEGSTLPYAACATGTLVGWKPVYFGVACRAHDECYGRKGAKKSECDASFLSLLKSTCDETLTSAFRKLSKTNCYNTASEYHHQVDLRGCEAFTNAQKRVGISNPSCKFVTEPDQVNKIVVAIVEETTTKLPTLTNPTSAAGSSPALPAGDSNICGSDVSKYLVPDYVCLDAQGERVPYAGCDGGRGYGTLVRYKIDFSGACKQHDLCYGKVGATKSQCDTELYQSMNSSCRTQLPSELGEKATRRCYETALLFNDVVRGQATNRFGIWMTQQVPFTGKSGCEAFVSAQRAAGNLNATCAQPQPQPGGQDTPPARTEPPGRLVYETCFQQECFKEYLVTKNGNIDGVMVANVAAIFYFNEAGFSKNEYKEEFSRLNSIPVKHSTYKVSCRIPGGYIEFDNGKRIPQPERNLSHATESEYKIWSAVCDYITFRIVSAGENAPESIARVLSVKTIAPGRRSVDVAYGPCRDQSKVRKNITVDSNESLSVGDLFFQVPVSSSPANPFALRRARPDEKAQYDSCRWR